MLRGNENWWSGRGGMRDTVSVALPLMMSMVSATVMIFTDRVFLAHYSTEAVAAALPAGNLVFAAVALPLGLASYTNTFVAQYFGAGRYERIGAAVGQAALIGLVTVPLACATIPLAPLIVGALGHAPEIARLETEYYQALCWGESTVVLSAALSAFFTGRGDTRTVMIVDSSAAGLNVVLDYCWIFGHFGFPEMGAAGAAWATTAASLVRVATYILLWLRPAFRQRYRTLAGCRFDGALLARLLRYGAPNGLQYLFEVGAFSVFLVLFGRLGKEELAASNLAFNLNSFAFMPVLGIGLAVTTLVGRFLGEDRAELASRATRSAWFLAAGLMLPLAAVYLLLPDMLLGAYGLGDAAHGSAEVHATAAVLLRFVAFYCLFDAMNVIFAGALKGAGDTRFVLATTISVALAAAAVTWLGTIVGNFGLYWCWIGVSAWVCTLGIVFVLRYLQGRWRTMRVIETRLDSVQPFDDLAVDTESPIPAAEQRPKRKRVKLCRTVGDQK